MSERFDGLIEKARAVPIEAEPPQAPLEWPTPVIVELEGEERDAILREERALAALDATEGNADQDQLAIDIIRDFAANPPPSPATPLSFAEWDAAYTSEEKNQFSLEELRTLAEDADWTFEEHQRATRYVADLGAPLIAADDIGKGLEAAAEPFHPAGNGHEGETHQERQEQPRSKRALIGINPADWEGVEVPSRKWVVPDYIPDETVTLLYADGGTGKSYLDLQLAVARAVAKEWIGLLPEPGRTLVLSAEDDANEMHRRLEGIRKFYGAAWSDLKDIRLVDLVGEDCVLGELNKGRIHPTEMYHALDAYMTEFRPGLTCLDVLADMYGGDEINRVQVRQFVGLLKKLSLKHHCAILLLAHPSITGMNSGTGTSGSTGWSNAVRSRLYFQTVKGEEGDESNKAIRTFEGMKANYGERGGKFDLVWKEGLFRRVNGPAGLDKLATERKAEDVFLTLLKRFAEQHRPARVTEGKSYAPSLFAVEPGSQGLKSKDFAAAMLRLLDQGKILNELETEGAPSKRLRRLVIS